MTDHQRWWRSEDATVLYWGTGYEILDAPDAPGITAEEPSWYFDPIVETGILSGALASLKEPHTPDTKGAHFAEEWRLWRLRWGYTPEARRERRRQQQRVLGDWQEILPPIAVKVRPPPLRAGHRQRALLLPRARRRP